MNPFAEHSGKSTNLPFALKVQVPHISLLRIRGLSTISEKYLQMQGLAFRSRVSHIEGLLLVRSTELWDLYCGSYI